MKWVLLKSGAVTWLEFSALGPAGVCVCVCARTHVWEGPCVLAHGGRFQLRLQCLPNAGCVRFEQEGA